MTHTAKAAPKGIVTPLATPLNEDESLDRAAFQRLVERQVEAGVDGVFALGTVGEGPLLPEEVRIETVRAAVEAAAGAVPVFAGAMDNSIRRVLDRLDAVARAGADAAAVTLPYYGWYPHRDAAVEFFLGIADRAPLPVIVYNLPRVSGMSLDHALVRQFYDHPALVGIKDTRGDADDMAALAADPERRGRLTYLPGNSALAARLFEAGADGLVSVLSNFMPELLVALYRAHRGGESERRDACGRVVADLGAVLSCPTTAGGVKCALELIGIGHRRTVRPWPQAGAEDEAKVCDLLARAREQVEAEGLLSPRPVSPG